MAGAEHYDVDIGVFLKDNASRPMAAITRGSAGMTDALSRITMGAGGAGGAMGSLSMVFAGLARPLFALGGPLGIVTGGLATVGSLGAMAAGVMGRVFTGAVNLASRAVQAAVRPVQMLGSALLRYGKYAALGAAAAFTLFARQATIDFAQYDQAVVNAITVTGLMGDAFDEARRAIFGFGLEVSLASAKMPTEIAQAFYALGSAGLDVAQQMDSARGVIALGEATMADMGQTTELVVSAMKAFGLRASDTDRIVNALAATISSSQMRIDRLAESLPYAAATAHGFNVPLERTLALLATLVDRGLQASMAGTGLRAVFAQLTDVSDKAAAALGKYGLGVADVNIAQRGLMPVLASLQKAQMTQADLFAIFGVRAANAANILLNAGVPAIEAFTEKITGTNRAYEMQERMLDTLLGQWMVFKSTVQFLRIEFARRMVPALRRGNEALRQFVASLIDMGVARRFGRIVRSAIDGIIDRGERLFREVDISKWLQRAYNWGLKAWDVLTGIGRTLWDWGTMLTGYVRQGWEWLEGHVLKGQSVRDFGNTVTDWFKKKIPEAWDWLVDHIDEGAELISASLVLTIGTMTTMGFTMWAVAAIIVKSLQAIGVVTKEAGELFDEMGTRTMKALLDVTGVLGKFGGEAVTTFGRQGVLGQAIEESLEQQAKAIETSPALRKLRALQEAIVQPSGFRAGSPLAALQRGIRGTRALAESPTRTPLAVVHDIRITIDGNARWIELLERDPEGRAKLSRLISDTLVAEGYRATP